MQASNKPKKQKILINLDDIDIFKSINPTSSNEQRKQVFKLIYQLKIKQHPQLKQRLTTALIKRDSPIQELLQQFKSLMEFFKEYQTMTPVIDIYYSVYKQAMMSKSQNLQLFWNYWRCVPLTNLQDYIQSFKLQNIINKIEPNEFYNIIRDLLLRSKNKQAALYCHLFDIKDKEFLIKEVLPRLLQGQDIYTNYVTNLLKHNPILLDAIVQELDPVAAIRIVETAGGDVTKYPKLIKHLQHSTFKHNANQFKDWYKCEQILGFCPTLLQLYAQEFLVDQVKTSFLVRNKLAQGQQTVKNPLFSNDSFTYTQEIVGKNKDKKYWKLVDFGIEQKDVIFVDEETSAQFQMMEDVLLKSQMVGFDSQFRATSHKYQADGVSIIQLSASKKIFIIDFIKLSHSQNTINLLKKLFESKEIVKVGHSLKCDFLYLNKTMNLPNQYLNSFMDIADLFKIKYPQQNQSSLSYIVLALTSVQLSKYQQRSNWNKRPLRKAQLHYAALDAYICEVLYQKLSGDAQLSSLQLQKSQKVMGTLVIQDGWLSYGPQYAHFIKKPKFIVDNMLKKLSTYLRNLGLDAEYLSVRDFEVAISIASNEQRIILTKDKHLKFRKNIRVPVYLIQSQESQNMTKEVVAAFKIKLEQYTLLSRCVKCNNSQLTLVDRQQALAKLNFKHPDSKIQEFWSCNKCQQFYWQGHSYNNSRKRFSTFI